MKILPDLTDHKRHTLLRIGCFFVAVRLTRFWFKVRVERNGVSSKSLTTSIKISLLKREFEFEWIDTRTPEYFRVTLKEPRE